VALWGASGFVGSTLMKSCDLLPVVHGQDHAGKELPSVSGIIWCAGWPGKKNISDVEANPIRSKLANVWEPLELAERCKRSGRQLLIMSSGCLYDRLNPEGSPWREDEPPNFTGPVYHRDKWEAERGLSQFGDLVTIFRFRLPFNSSRHPRNMLHKFAQWDRVMNIDQSFTWLPDLAKAVRAWQLGIISNGTWHVTQPGTLNNFDAVKKYLNPNVEKIEGTLEEYTQASCARSHAILDSSKLGRVIELTEAEKAWRMECRRYRAMI